MSEFGRNTNTATSLKPADLTDVGQAMVLVREYGNKVRYCPATGWLVYDGRRWVADDLRAQGIAHELTARQLKEARTALATAQKAETIAVERGDKLAEDQAKKDVTAAKAFHSWVLTRRKSSSISASLTEARPSLQINPIDLDNEPHLLNAQDGTLDLPTGKKMPHRASDYITKITGVPLSADERGREMWRDFLRVITCENKELEEYLQMTAGMMAVGKTYCENLLILYGGGRNGKTTYTSVLAQVFGDYAGSLSAELLSIDCRRNKSPELAELRGKRAIFTSEPPRMGLDTSYAKRLTSNEVIYAEKKYRDPFAFKPSHLLVMSTNTLPTVSETDKGTWRRLVVVPFDAVIEPEDDIKDYAGILFKEAGGAILEWIVEGARRFIQNKYTVELPACVRDAIAQYRKDNDWLAAYVSERCETGKGLVQRSGELYSDYRAYCERNGDHIRSLAIFKSALENAGFKTRKTMSGAIVTGLNLIEHGYNHHGERYGT